MLRKKLAESLTARIFLITALILLCAGTVTFGMIAWATPLTYTSVFNDDLARQMDDFAATLADTNLEDCGPLLDGFIRSSGADAALLDPDGRIVNVGSQLAIRPVYEDESVMTGDSIASAAAQSVTWESGTEAGSAVTVTVSGETAIAADVQFADQDETYSLYVVPRVRAENLAVRALAQIAPWLLLALLIFSLLCALVYSRYITRPIVRISAIAGKMAELDFHWECGGQRWDEIGSLERSLDQMAHRLSAALRDLEEANRALRGEVEREKELDRQRMAFFSAASHELKTPVTILKGQLSGMLEGVDVYRDRDKYLLRSLQVTGRMENLIQEMLAISRMETGSAVIRQDPVDLSAVLRTQTALDADLLEQRGQRLISSLAPRIMVTGDNSLLGKAVGNLLSNASLYSPEGAEIRVWCGMMQDRPAFTVENTGAHISEDALPHLFEAFYREEGSRNRKTGGSGLGLYLVRMILERHRAVCTIENTEDGVRAIVLFLPDDTP
ncbi:MAG TPA: HAMP domain-containing protein [Candidatus Gallacutalibacter pullicola]|uniref:histidine kinase n=1 Tax=Candidatus Gallacutalibacter pullicola TaxID=2840830 RepID=A0A9D1DSN8_9FIRM|nr:HAMP domain-containing protein [Candidatus Gallacutalibacter pullicola]